MNDLEQEQHRLERRELLAKLKKASKPKKNKVNTDIKTVDRSKPLALSGAQERLWFFARLDEQASKAYHIPSRLHIIGELNRVVLDRTLATLIERHEILRTSFIKKLSDDDPIQIIHDGHEFALVDIDLSELDDHAQRSRLAQELEFEAEA